MQESHRPVRASWRKKKKKRGSHASRASPQQPSLGSPSLSQVQQQTLQDQGGSPWRGNSPPQPLRLQQNLVDFPLLSSASTVSSTLQPNSPLPTPLPNGSSKSGTENHLSDSHFLFFFKTVHKLHKDASDSLIPIKGKLLPQLESSSEMKEWLSSSRNTAKQIKLLQTRWEEKGYQTGLHISNRNVTVDNVTALESIIAQLTPHTTPKKAPQSTKGKGKRVYSPLKTEPQREGQGTPQRVNVKSWINKNYTANQQKTLRDLNGFIKSYCKDLQERKENIRYNLLLEAILQHFKISKFEQLGLGGPSRVPKLLAIIKDEGFIAMYISGFVTIRAIGTLYDLKAELDLCLREEEIKHKLISNLLEYPLVKRYFQPASGITSIPPITGLEVLKDLSVFKYKSRSKRISPEEFVRELARLKKVTDPYELCVKVNGLGLAIKTMGRVRKLQFDQLKAFEQEEEKRITSEENIPILRSRAKKNIKEKRKNDEKEATSLFKDFMNVCRGKNFATILSILHHNKMNRPRLRLLVAKCLESQHSFGSNFDTGERKGGKNVGKSLAKEEEIVDLVKAMTTDMVFDVEKLVELEHQLVKHFQVSRFFDLGFGDSFLCFLLRNKLVFSGHGNTALLSQVLDFIHDFVEIVGKPLKPAILEHALCSYFGVKQVEDLGYGGVAELCARKHKPQQKVLSLDLMALASLHEEDIGKNDGMLGWRSSDEAKDLLNHAPYLVDLSQWTHWDAVFSQRYGDLKSFIEENCDFSVVENKSRGVIQLLKYENGVETEDFKKRAEKGDAFGTVSALVSIICSNGSIQGSSLNLLQVHLESALREMYSNTDSSVVLQFVLDCLCSLPSSLRTLPPVAGIFVSTLDKVVRNAKEELLSLCAEDQRVKIEEIGIHLKVDCWIKSFQNKIDYSAANSVVFQQEGYELEESATIGKGKEKEIEEKKEEKELEKIQKKEKENVKEKEMEKILTGQREEVGEESVEGYSPLKLVETIRREEFEIGKSGRENGSYEQKLARSLRLLSTELYSKDSHFILELVQNADDNDYLISCPSLKFEIAADNLVVLNNEVGFAPKNIRALCDVGKSTKKDKVGYIGQKGIGFKSVFRVTDAPEIHSNGFHIQFNAKNDNALGFVVPTWIGDSEEQDQDNHKWKTKIVLPLKVEGEEMLRKCDDIKPSLLLFLQKLRKITIQDCIDNTKRVMKRTDLGDGIVEVNCNQSVTRWLLVKKTLKTEVKRENVSLTEIALAFPLHSSDHGDKSFTDLWRLDKTNEQQHAFAYLPLRVYGFRFIIQGDFIVPSSREDVDSDNPWNQWLRNEYPALFFEALEIFKRFAKDESQHSDRDSADIQKPNNTISSMASHFLQFVPIEGEVSGFFSPVAKAIQHKMKNNNCMLSQGLEWKKPHEILLPSPDQVLNELVSSDMLVKYLGKYFLHSTVEITPALCEHLDMKTFCGAHLVRILEAFCKERKKAVTKRNLEAIKADMVDSDDDGESLDQIMVEEDSLDFDNDELRWISRCLAFLNNYLESNRNKSETIGLDADLCSIPLMKLTSGEITALNSGTFFFPPDLNSKPSVSITEGNKGPVSKFQHELQMIDPCMFEIENHHQLVKLLERLGVKLFSPKEIIESHILQSWREATSDVQDGLKVDDNGVFVAYMAFIKDYFEKYQQTDQAGLITELKNISFVKTLTGIKPLSITSIHFSSSFGNKWDLLEDFQCMEWNILHDDYLQYGDAQTWRRFFSLLGVLDFVSVKRCGGIDWESEEFRSLINAIKCQEITSDIAIQRMKNKMNLVAEILSSCWKDYAPYGKKDDSTESTFLSDLKNTNWLPSKLKQQHEFSENVLFKPNQLILPSKKTDELFRNSDHVPYTLSSHLSKEFARAIGMQVTLSIDLIFDILMSWSKKSLTRDLKCLGRIYQHLWVKQQESTQAEEKIRRIFNEKKVVYLPKDGKGKYFKASEVFWAEPSRVMDTYGIRVVKRYYTEKVTKFTLKDFFLSNGVRSVPPFELYVSKLQKIASKNAVDRVMNTFIAVFSMWSAELQILDLTFQEQCKRRDFLLDKAIFPTHAKQWVSLQDLLFINDDDSLRKHFKQCPQVHFILGPKYIKAMANQSAQQLAQEKGKEKDNEEDGEEQQRSYVPQNPKMQPKEFLVQTCSIPLISECVKREIITEGTYFESVIGSVISFMIPYIQRYIFTNNKSLFVQLTQAGVPARLGSFECLVVKRLDVIYKVEGPMGLCVESNPVMASCFMDVDKYCLYIALDAVKKYHLVFGELTRIFFGGVNEELANLLALLAEKYLHHDNPVECCEEHVRDYGMKDLPSDELHWRISAAGVSSEQAVDKHLHKKQPDGVGVEGAGDEDVVDELSEESDEEYITIYPKSSDAPLQWPPTAPKPSASSLGFMSPDVSQSPVIVDDKLPPLSSLSNSFSNTTNGKSNTAEEIEEMSKRKDNNPKMWEDASNNSSLHLIQLSTIDVSSFANSDSIPDKELGRWGEQVVSNFLKEKGKVIWINEIEEKGKEFDILFQEKFYIEVKTTRTSTKHHFEMSFDELAFAEKHKENYHIYRLYAGTYETGVLQFAKIIDPIALCRNGAISIILDTNTTTKNQKNTQQISQTTN